MKDEKGMREERKIKRVKGSGGGDSSAEQGSGALGCMA